MGWRERVVPGAGLGISRTKIALDHEGGGKNNF